MWSLGRSRWLASLLTLAVASAAVLGALPHTHQPPTSAGAGAGEHLATPAAMQEAHPDSCLACLISHAPSLDPEAPIAAAHLADGIRLEAADSSPQPVHPCRLPQGRAPPSISL